MKILKHYKSLSFEEKTIFNVRISILMNLLLAVAKMVLSVSFGIFFLVSGLVNAFLMFSKMECYLGERSYKNIPFEKRNIKIALFLLLSGIIYVIYMSRLLLTDVYIFKYDIILGICVALVSFVELAFAIKGCFNAYGKGHYYRNIKLISLCSALTAIVLTQIAITSFATSVDTRLLNGLFGLFVGIVIVLISCYIFVAPRISLIGKEHNVYVFQDSNNELEYIEIELTHSMFYGNYVYIGKRIANTIDGYITKMKSPLFSHNIYVNIILILLSEILIFPYAIGALIFHFKCRNIILKLDEEMERLGLIRK